MRGGEKCLEVVGEIFPDADIFTLFHEPGAVSPAIERHRIRTSRFQNLPGIRRLYRFLLPLFPRTIERFDLGAYDLVISLSHAVAKGAIAAPGARHLCYCFSPMRYIWDLYADYFGRLPGPARAVTGFAASRLRAWDASTAPRVDEFAAISDHVRQRIRRYYGREAVVVHPPVEDVYFESPLPDEPGEYLLVVSALEPYKRIDQAIALSRETGAPLWIVGKGTEERRLRRLAPPSVRFLGWQPAERLPELYRRSRALVFPGVEDFGIAPLESQAMGRPVLAYGAGGALETVRPVGGDEPTGVLFAHDGLEGLLEGYERLARHEASFVPEELRRHASRFRRDRFRREFRSFVEGEATAC